MTLLTKVSTLLVLALLLLGPATIGSSPPAAAQDDEPLRFVFVTHDLGAGIFAPVRTGMEDACELIGATCEFLGPQTYDPAQQVAILEAAIATEPDGIATTRPEPGVYDDVIQRAQEAGISVVTFNTNDPTADEVAPTAAPATSPWKSGSAPSPRRWRRKAKASTKSWRPSSPAPTKARSSPPSRPSTPPTPTST
jgi:ABC-type sugar transport system substrate-binding protein